jgi:branched-chain amino acid transport system permease protein
MLQLVTDGLIVGSIIALGAIGVTLTYSLLRFANFAHGELLTWGAYLALSFLAGFLALAGAPMRPLGPFSFGWPLLSALAAAAAATAGIALAVEALVFRRLRARGAAIVLVIASFGVALALRNLVLFVYGGVPEYYSRELQIAIRILPRDVWGGIRITPDQLFVLGLAATLVLVLHLLLTRSTLGRSMRAAAENPALARVAGIDVERIIRWTWAIGASLAATAGVFAGLVAQVRPTLGLDLLLPLFSAAILGSSSASPRASPCRSSARNTGRQRPS